MTSLTLKPITSAQVILRAAENSAGDHQTDHAHVLRSVLLDTSTSASRTLTTLHGILPYRMEIDPLNELVPQKELRTVSTPGYIEMMQKASSLARVDDAPKVQSTHYARAALYIGGPTVELLIEQLQTVHVQLTLADAIEALKGPSPSR